MTTKTDLPNIPEALIDAALIDGPTCAAVGDVSVSWWHEEVRAGRAPQPAIRQSRFTRWRLADVRAFWIALAECATSAERATSDAQVMQRAAQASIKAREPAAVARAQATRKARAAARQQAGA